MEKVMISVDVIVPCYRYGHLLGECVESVLMQPLITLVQPSATADGASILV
jgi:hypothetical protein